MEPQGFSSGEGSKLTTGAHEVSTSNAAHDLPDLGCLTINGTSSTHEVLKPTCNIITPVGMLGFGLHSDQTDAALASKIPNGAPTAIILDAGSTDGGPEKLALGKMTIPRDTYIRDLKTLIPMVWKHKIPLIFSSAGGDGSDEHVEEMLDIVREVCGAEENSHYTFKALSIFSGISKTLISQRLTYGKITGCGKPVPPLTQQKIDKTPRIVGQMGPEPMLEAMLANSDFNIMITGRAYDPAPYVAFAAFASGQSLDDTSSAQARAIWGGFTHMGKVLECGGICALPKSNGAMGTMYADGTFDLTPLDPKSRCTPISVAAHTLYEKSRPDILYGPGGYLDLTNMKTEALEDGRSVRVRGGEFKFLKDEETPYTLKLEGAEVVGYRSHMLGSFRDPILISQLDSFLERVKEYVALQHEDQKGTWELDFHVYGQNQVSTLPVNKGQPGEIFVIGEALASTQALATSVAATARVACTHGPYPGQKATSGNLAYGLGGHSYFELGPCAQFSVYHLMELEEGEEQLKLHQGSPGLFKLKIDEIKANNTSESKHDSASSAEDAPKPKVESHVPNIATSQQTKKLNPETLGDISSLLRSKNSGPYEITLDVMFESQAVYKLVKASAFLNSASMAKLFHIAEDDIVWNGFFDQALAYKVTIPRLRNGKPTASGGYMENDVHASQQYIAFMNLSLPPKVVEGWNKLAVEEWDRPKR